MSTATRRGTLHNLKNWITRSNTVAHKSDGHEIDDGMKLQRGEYLLVEITDSGNGLSKSLIDTIFDEYLPRVKNDISSMRSTANLLGNNPLLNKRGLGLPIAKGQKNLNSLISMKILCHLFVYFNCVLILFCIRLVAYVCLIL